ncbi:hypothetical protein SISNIDRAFT_483185 [Sistotremastrum niveocremeum HHB9708]|uniref:Uncharacterized protein n=1 Tax=Sistotremastrum niveocremeum HHB9708 TaxID=1314777 RepID=A0A164X9B9_9AGAM|nr:hypothetical protein SISNIDRAFT_483185 [Sistotremastrum niveocremeum HHB9708]
MAWWEEDKRLLGFVWPAALRSRPQSPAALHSSPSTSSTPMPQAASLQPITEAIRELSQQVKNGAQSHTGQLVQTLANNETRLRELEKLTDSHVGSIRISEARTNRLEDEIAAFKNMVENQTRQVNHLIQVVQNIRSCQCSQPQHLQMSSSSSGPAMSSPPIASPHNTSVPFTTMSSPPVPHDNSITIPHNQYPDPMIPYQNQFPQ